MRLFWINILAIVIAFSSLLLQAPSVDFGHDQLASIQANPSWQSDALKNPNEKNSEKSQYIAQDFTPIVVLADFQDFTGFQYYIPIYNLHRQKEYFLLI
jgi:hypothetical protein